MTGHPVRHLPAWRTVLVVVAHPDDESFGLGALLDTLTRQGAEVHVLCLTVGEASTLHGVAGDLATVRAAELAAAARTLGLAGVTLLHHPDGRLADLPAGALRGAVDEALASVRPDGLLVFDNTGVTGHPDHRAATAAGVAAATTAGLPVLGWTLPEQVARTLGDEHGVRFAGRQPCDIHLEVPVDRAGQLRAVHDHPSQALPGSVLWRRLELLGDVEHLRWLRRPTTRPVRRPAAARRV